MRASIVEKLFRNVALTYLRCPSSVNDWLLTPESAGSPIHSGSENGNCDEDCARVTNEGSFLWNISFENPWSPAAHTRSGARR